jgi:hypothetical protein
MDNLLLNDKILAISNLLEQIENVNEMIEMHQVRGQEGSFMTSQYENRKLVFIQNLQNLLSDFQIKVYLETQAA